MGTTPVDLFRRGNAASARMDHVRPNDDITVYRNADEDWVQANSGGVSTFSVRKGDGKWWKLVQGYAYDNRLRVRNDHGNHYLWEPMEDMPLARFKALLAEINPRFNRVE